MVGMWLNADLFFVVRNQAILILVATIYRNDGYKSREMHTASCILQPKTLTPVFGARCIQGVMTTRRLWTHLIVQIKNITIRVKIWNKMKWPTHGRDFSFLHESLLLVRGAIRSILISLNSQMDFITPTHIDYSIWYICRCYVCHSRFQ